jgi:hypothetical protein
MKNALIPAAVVFLAMTRPVGAGELPANTWGKLSEGGIGPKFSPGMVYAPKLKRFVLVGGAISRYPKGGPFPYDVLSAAPGSRKWRNEFPKGVDWTPEFGPAKVPAWKSWRFSTKDEKGNVRPHMRHTRMYYQYCLDTDQNCVWAIINDRTMRLDLATMTWEDLGYKGTPRGLLWASMCYDPVNAEVVLFGGARRNPQPQGETWLFSTGTREWRKWAGDLDEARRDNRERERLRGRARDMISALRNRLHRTERPGTAKADLGAKAQQLEADLTAMMKKLEDAVWLRRHEQSSLGGTVLLKQGISRLAQGRELLTKGAAYDALRTWQQGLDLLDRAQALCASRPSPRLMAPMACDREHDKIVMFGGDRWDHMCNEVWVYHCKAREWAQQLRDFTPSPRAGHALVYLPKAKKILLIGGYTYRTSMSYCTNLYQAAPFEMWTYDVKTNVWERVRHSGKAPLVSHVGRSPVAVAAGVTEDDVVQLIGLDKALSTWAIRVVPMPTPEQPKTGPSEETRRGLCFDPAWFDESVKDAKPEAVAAKLKALPPNKWVAMHPPKRLFNRDWGTQVFDFDRDQILHWSGGHSAYCGTAPAHYSVKLNRWSIGFAPELPMEHTYSAGVGGTSPASTFTGRPFAPHTYKSYCYHPQSKKLVWLHESKVWVYDPDRRDWESSPKRTPFNAERHTTIACPTPHGIAAWAVPAGKGVYHGWRGLWLLTDLEANTWRTLVKPTKKQLFPVAYGDRHGMGYDAKRDRLYLFHFGRKSKHQIWVYDFKTGKAELVNPAGGKGFPASASMGREPVYLPDDDLVFLASRVKGSGPVTLLYEPAANRWLKMDPAFDKDKKGRPIRPHHGVSCGVMWDPARKRLWASSSRGRIYVMRFDRERAAITPLE